MSGNEGIWIIGSGGHAKVVIVTARAAGVKVNGLIDHRPEVHGNEVLGIRVVGDVDLLPPMADCVVAVGDALIRKRIVTELRNITWRSVVHPHAEIAEGASLGAGSVVFTSAVVQPGTRIGDHAIVNTGAIVEHDNDIAGFVQVATGALLTGNVTVGEGSFIGAGAVVLPGLFIGEWCTIGAGAVVTRDVADAQTVVGVPARPI